jgi:hypothetical protein
MPGCGQGTTYIGIERAQTFGGLHDTARTRPWARRARP